MTDQIKETKVELKFTVTTPDGRIHTLDILKEGDRINAPEYFGNNKLIDDELRAILDNTNRVNTGLI